MGQREYSLPFKLVDLAFPVLCMKSQNNLKLGRGKYWRTMNMYSFYDLQDLSPSRFSFKRFFL
jgi:hypothetical protein